MDLLSWCRDRRRILLEGIDVHANAAYEETSRRLLYASVMYLPVLFALMVIDKP